MAISSISIRFKIVAVISNDIDLNAISEEEAGDLCGYWLDALMQLKSYGDAIRLLNRLLKVRCSSSLRKNGFNTKNTLLLKTTTVPTIHVPRHVLTHSVFSLLQTLFGRFLAQLKKIVIIMTF